MQILAAHVKAIIIDNGDRRCPTCHQEVPVSLFTPSRNESITNRTAVEIRAGQSRARLDDANTSTRPNTVTVRELQQRTR